MVVISFVISIEKFLLCVSEPRHIILPGVRCEELIAICLALWLEHNVALVVLVYETVLPIDNGLSYSWRSTWVEYGGLREWSWFQMSGICVVPGVTLSGLHQMIVYFQNKNNKNIIKRFILFCTISY